jgi:hypothetical protein
MNILMTPMLVAHLIGESWHVAELLLYGGAGLGLILGIGLFLWGRVERGQVPNTVVSDADGEASTPRDLPFPELIASPQHRAGERDVSATVDGTPCAIWEAAGHVTRQHGFQ